MDADEQIKPMDEASKAKWRKIFKAAKKKRRQTMHRERNHLARKLGRLVIEYNSLENNLAFVLMAELMNLFSVRQAPEHGKQPQIPQTLNAALNSNLNQILMGTMSFKQKLDFLMALLNQRFTANEARKKSMDKIAGLLASADEYRNKMIHSVWTQSLEGFSRVKVQTKGMKGLRVERAFADLKHLRMAIEAMMFLNAFGLEYLVNPKSYEEFKTKFSTNDEVIYKVLKEHLTIASIAHSQQKSGKVGRMDKSN